MKINTILFILRIILIYSGFIGIAYFYDWKLLMFIVFIITGNNILNNIQSGKWQIRKS